MNDAIKKAEEGGYEYDFSSIEKTVAEMQKYLRDWAIIDPETTLILGNLRRMLYEREIEKALLKPLFWQCLGKAEGHEYDFDTPKIDASKEVGIEGAIKRHPWWLHQQHRLIDHLAEGKSVDRFFDDLLKK